MDSLQLRAIFAGLLFGLYPFFLSKSGLSGLVSAAVLTLVELVCIAPFVLYSWGPVGNINWSMAILAGLLGAVSVVAFSSMLAQAPRQNIGILLVLLTVCQAIVPAIFQVVDKGLSVSKVVGFILALAAVTLLCK